MNRLLSLCILLWFCLPTLAQEPDESTSSNARDSKSEAARRIADVLEAWADELKAEDVPADPEYLTLSNPPIELGDTTDRTRELQATLNKRLLKYQEEQEEGFIRFSNPVHVGPLEPDRGLPKDGVRRFEDPDGRFLAIQVRGDWIPVHQNGERIRNEDFLEDEKLPAHGIILPDENDPLKVDGVYGQRTYAGVMLFQKINHLPVTGEVDAVTLDKLEPLVPTNPLLAGIMDWVETRLNDRAPGDPTFFKDDDRPWWVKTITALIMTLMILLAAGAVYQIARSMAKSTRFLSRWLFTPSTSPWFNMMREKQVFLRMAQLAPAAFIYITAILIFPKPTDEPAQAFPYLDVFQDWHQFVSRLGLAYAALIFVLVSLAFADACNSLLSPDHEAENPISGIVRASKRIVTLVGILLIVAALSGQSPWRIIGGLGAFMAVILLVFRDYLLGLVASVQIIANKMVQVGDWIEMPKFGADGDVTTISLNVIKVQNFDKTISTIPTHSLLSESFRNWSGMRDFGGRRIKRSVYIDVHSITVCTPELISRFKRMELIEEYVAGKLDELFEYNARHDTDASPVNSRRLTNIGTFRAYLDAYLAQHPSLKDDMIMVVRHLQPTKMGLPIEIYAYCRETQLRAYEAAQADIFDHILAILPEFELRAFQDVTNEFRESDEDEEVSALRQNFEEAQQYVHEQNSELANRPNSRVYASIRRVEKKLAELGLEDQTAIESSGRVLSLAWTNGPP